MDEQALHREILRDHYERPHRRGLREPFDAEVRRVNPVCGDQVVLRLVLDGERVTDVRHDALGCMVSLASVSVMGDLVAGGTTAQALAVRERFVQLVRGAATEQDRAALGDALAFAGVARHPARVRCALLGWDALEEALTGTPG